MPLRGGKFVPENIKTLLNEGKKHSQAVAIALSLSKKKKKGGKYGKK